MTAYGSGPHHLEPVPRDPDDRDDKRVRDSKVYIRTDPGHRPQADVDAEIRDCIAHGVTQARTHLAKGKPGRALYALVRSLEAQARIAGIRMQPTDPKADLT